MRFLSLLILLAFTATAHAKTHNAAISDDGKFYATLSDLEGQRIVSIFDLDNKDAKPVAVGLGAFETDELHWIGSSHVLARVINMKSKVQLVTGLKELSFDRWVSIDAKSGKITMMFGNAGGDDYAYYVSESGSLLSTLADTPETALFSRMTVRRTARKTSRIDRGGDKQVHSLIQLNVKNNRERRQEWGQEETARWVVNAQGALIARIDRTETKNDWHLLKVDGKGMQKIVSIDFDDVDIEDIRVLGPAQEDGFLVARIKDDNGAWKFQKLDLSTGDFSDAYPNFIQVGSREEVYDPRRAKAHAIIQEDGAKVYHFNAQDRKLQSMLEQSIAGASVLIESTARDNNRRIIKAMYADKPDERYFFDLDAKKLELIARD